MTDTPSPLVSAKILDRLRSEAAMAHNDPSKPILARSFDLAVTEIERLHKWVFATSRSFKRSGLTLEEYNHITADVIDAFEQRS